MKIAISISIKLLFNKLDGIIERTRWIKAMIASPGYLSNVSVQYYD